MRREVIGLRRKILRSFTETGEQPPVEHSRALEELQEAHVVVLGDDGRILMAHPFAGHRERARVDADGRTWWGNCAWDGLGIVAALGLREASVTCDGITIGVRGGEVRGDAVFDVAIPARDWWVDIGET